MGEENLEGEMTKWILGVWGLIWIFAIAFWVGVGYVAWHFISKWW